MKLYYACGTCALAPHIVALEAGIPLELEKVDIAKTPHATAGGGDYAAINPNGYVPTLLLGDGSVLTEGIAITLYLADRKPEAGLAPPAGSPEGYRHLSWLTFIATELHKMYSPWLFHPEAGEQARLIAREKIGQRLRFVDQHLAAGGPFLMGQAFSAADAYLFTIVGWSGFAQVDLAAFSHVRRFMDQVGARPQVREAMQAEGMKAAA